MHRQTKFILLLSGLIAVLLIGTGIIGLVYWQQQTKVSANTNTIINTNNAENVNSNPQNTNTEVSANTNSTENTNASGDVTKTPEQEQAFLKQLARSFTERYGSFSNQNNYENLVDLKIYMTEKMQQEVEKYIKDAKKSQDENADYYGITTRVLSISEQSFDNAAGSAVYNVSTQRQEAKGLTGKERIYQQSASLEFKKVNNTWKVQDFAWN